MGRWGRVAMTAALTGSLAGPVGLAALPGAASGAPALGAGASTGCGWSVVAGPQLGGSSILYGVSSVASDDVWAVGSAGDVFGPDSLAEHWDGAAWSTVHTPNPRRSANDGNVLDAVDATGGDDVWAVGAHIRRGGIGSSPLIEHFDGARWRLVPPPPGHYLDSELTGVAAIAPDDAWVVGYRVERSTLTEAPMAMHWDGTAWSLVRVPNPPGDRDDELHAVSATGPDDVWAVGQAGERTTLTLHFDGDRWRTVPSPNPPGDARNSLNGVVAVARDDAWAVGTGGVPSDGISAHWDGSAWHLVDLQPKGEFDEMVGIAAQDGGTLWAVGLYRPAKPAYQTLAERFDGSAWSISKTPSLDKGDQLEGVTVAGSDVWAVGVTASGPDFQPGAALILRCSAARR